MSFTELNNTYVTYKVIHSAALASGAEQNVTNGAATIYSLFVDNPSAVNNVVYLKLYDTIPDGGIVADNSDPDYVFKIDLNSARQIAFPSGLPISTGLSLRCVETGGTAGTTAPSGGSVVVTVIYK